MLQKEMFDVYVELVGLIHGSKITNLDTSQSSLNKTFFCACPQAVAGSTYATWEPDLHAEFSDSYTVLLGLCLVVSRDSF